MHVIVQVQVGELPLRNSEIEHLEVRQELGRHTVCQLHFTRDRDTDVSLENLLGCPAKVTLRDEAGTEEIAFEGTVSAGSQTHLLNYGSAFTLEALSESSRLEYRNTAYYPKSTIGDVARKLGADVADSPKTRSPLDYVQLGETDFEFLLRLADEGGCFVCTVGKQPELRAKFADRGTELRWGQNLLAVTASCRPANHGFKGSAYQTDEKRDHRFHGVRKTPVWLGGAPKLIAPLRELAARTTGGGDPQLEEASYRTPTIGDFKTALERESERTLGAALLIEGSSTAIMLRAGDGVDINDQGNFKLPTTGKLGVLRVVHRFDAQQYSNEFTATPWAGYTNLQRPPRRLMPGPVTAEVVDNEDPSHMGRLKVRYRWQDVGEQTRWVHVVTPHSGNGRGFVFMPEIGDEVMVAYEQGDPERPFVLGTLWNGKDLAPQGDVTKNGVKRIVTRSGNTIQLVDEDQKESIEIFSPEGQCWIQLANNGGQPVLTIHSEGDISLEAVGEIRMKCASLVQRVEADAYRAVGGAETAEISGNAILKSGMNLALSGGINTAVKAGVNIEAVAGAVHNIVGTLVHIQPPGFVSAPVNSKKAPEKKSAWAKQRVPKAAKGKSTADAKTPRTAK